MELQIKVQYNYMPRLDRSSFGLLNDAGYRHYNVLFKIGKKSFQYDIKLYLGPEQEANYLSTWVSLFNQLKTIKSDVDRLVQVGTFLRSITDIYENQRVKWNSLDSDIDSIGTFSFGLTERGATNDDAFCSYELMWERDNMSYSDNNMLKVNGGISYRGSQLFFETIYELFRQKDFHSLTKSLSNQSSNLLVHIVSGNNSEQL